VAALMLALLAAAPAAAGSAARSFQVPPPGASRDTTTMLVPAADSAGVVVVPAPADTAPRRRLPRSRWDQPRWVMLRSLALPGWGQIHNRAWIKAVGVAGSEIAMGAAIWNDERHLDRLSAEVRVAQADQDQPRFNAAVLAYNDVLDASIRRRWLLGGLIAFALLDAYVDAHFVDFEVEFERDPALPEGTPIPAAKVSVGWRF
jgi:uncharacterized protein DUF5683